MKRLLLLLALLLGAGVARAQIIFDDADLWLNRSRVRIQLEDLHNFGETTTGKLRLVLYATDEWDDDDREVLARIALRPLEAGETRHRIRKTVRYHRPGWGWFFVTVALQERTVDESGKKQWITRDRVEFDDAVYFSPAPWEFFWPF